MKYFRSTEKFRKNLMNTCITTIKIWQMLNVFMFLKWNNTDIREACFITFSNPIVFLLSFVTWGNHYPSVLLNFYHTHLCLYIINGTYIVLANSFWFPADHWTIGKVFFLIFLSQSLLLKWTCGHREKGKHGRDWESGIYTCVCVCVCVCIHTYIYIWFMYTVMCKIDS